MENFKHSEKAKDLQGFELIFYNSIAQMGMILCELSDATPDDIAIEKKENCLIVTATIKRGSSKMTPTKIAFYGSLLGTHFKALFTPAHYREFDSIAVNKTKYKEEVTIEGIYSGGV